MWSYAALFFRGFPGGSVAKHPPANAGDSGDVSSIPGLDDPLGKEMAIHSSVLAWEIAQTVQKATVHRVAKSQIQLSD